MSRGSPGLYLIRCRAVCDGTRWSLGRQEPRARPRSKVRLQLNGPRGGRSRRRCDAVKCAHLQAARFVSTLGKWSRGRCMHISVREREMDGPIPGRCVAIEPAAFLLGFAFPRHLRRMWACSWCFFTLSRTRSSRARCPVGHRNALFLWTGSPPRSCPVPFPAGRRESRRLAAASFELLIITASPLAGSLSRAPCVSPRFCKQGPCSQRRLQLQWTSSPWWGASCASLLCDVNAEVLRGALRRGRLWAMAGGKYLHA